MKYCFVIPHYNHEQAFSAFLPILKTAKLPFIVIDDGSEALSYQAIESLLSEETDAYLIQHNQNRGKGAAVFTGAQYASTLGFTHIIQIDADGQHDINDVEKFIEYSQQNPGTIISGKPYFDDDAPKARVYGRRVTDFWVALETLSLQIKDSLCGFRIYPLQQLEQIVDNHYIGVRMNFDTDMMVKAVWEKIPLHFIPTKVIYLENGVSHFHYLRDNLLLIKLHIRLLAGMLLRLPQLLLARLQPYTHAR